MPTLAEIEAAANAARLQMAQYLAPRIDAVRAALASEPVAALVVELTAIRDELPAQPGVEDRTQVGNIISVLTGLPAYFEHRASAVAAEIAALTPAETPPAAEG